MSSESRKPLKSTAELVAAGLVAPAVKTALDRVAQRYAVAVTPDLVRLIDRDDPADPIARQFVPDPSEIAISPEERGDPIGDFAHQPLKGIVHRYPDRVLLKPVHVCPVYCRYCFRREQVGPGGEALSETELEAALGYIAADPGIFEVILTGGDPLMLSPRRLAVLLDRLAAIPHVQVVRIHSRVPVADPSRIDEALLDALDRERPALYLAIHANHPREFTTEVRAACRRLGRRGIPLLGQSVLLAGVNDDAATLEALFRTMVATRIKPYYLHHADLAPGTARFRTSLTKGQELMRALRGRVSGLCQPTYVLDIPGGAGKVPVGPNYLGSARAADGSIDVRDPDGTTHRYPDLGGPPPSPDRAAAPAPRGRKAADGRD